MLKGLMIFFIISLLSNSFACSCGDELNRMGKNPLTAKTILVVNIKVKDLARTMSSEKPWPQIDKKLARSGCSVGGRPGKKALFLSIYPIEALKMDSVGIGSCDSSIIELPDAQRMIDLLAVAKELPVDHPNVFWGYCQEDSECTKINKSCGDVDSVNKKYKTNLENYIKESGSKCDRKNVKGKISKCLENFCS